MSIQIFPDFEITWKMGDRVITEQTVQMINGKLAIKTTQIAYMPAGINKARSIIFFDTDNPKYLEGE
jgi:hypothetical protein